MQLRQPKNVVKVIQVFLTVCMCCTSTGCYSVSVFLIPISDILVVTAGSYPKRGRTLAIFTY